MTAKILIFNKPYGVVSQFTDLDGSPGLRRFLNGEEMKGFYPAGRLDKDSEGLILLTNNGKLQNFLADPKHKVLKQYLTQVEGESRPDIVESFAEGLMLKDGKTKPALISNTSKPTWLAERDPPIRFRKNDCTSWFRITLSEGKNRQVRRMTAAVNLPTLRLIRIAYGDFSLDKFNATHLRVPGSWAFVDPKDVDSKLTYEFLDKLAIRSERRPAKNSSRYSYARQPSRKPKR